MYQRCRVIVPRLSRHAAYCARAVHSQGSSGAGRLSGATAAVLLAATAAAAAAAAAVSLPGATTCYYDESDPNKDRLGRWQDKWRKGELNWHRKEPYGALVAHHDKLTAGRPPAEVRVLVPLCGKTVDLPWLARQGHPTVGVEGVEAAVWALQRENWLNFVTAYLPRSAPAAGTAAAKSEPDFVAAPTFGGPKKGRVFKSGPRGVGYYADTPAVLAVADRRLPLRVVVCDFLDVGAAELGGGQFDAVWDRGSLVAVPPSARERYAHVINALLRPGGRVLLVTVDYPPTARIGPPFLVSENDLRNLFGPLGFTVEKLAAHDAKSEYTAGPWAAVSNIEESVYLLTKRGGGR